MEFNNKKYIVTGIIAFGILGFVFVQILFVQNLNGQYTTQDEVMYPNIKETEIVKRLDLQEKTTDIQEETDDVQYRYSDMGCRVGVESMGGGDISYGRDFVQYCPDGSILKINPETCDFEECPGGIIKQIDTSKWQIYKKDSSSVSIKYPKGWVVKEDRDSIYDLVVSFSSKDCGQCEWGETACESSKCWEGYYGYQLLLRNSNDKSYEQQKLSTLLKINKDIKNERIYMHNGGSISYRILLGESPDDFSYEEPAIFYPILFSDFVVDDFVGSFHSFTDTHGLKRGSWIAVEYARAALKTLYFQK